MSQVLSAAKESHGAHADLDELTHELRQPLSAIESLVCCLEISATDDQICRHLQKIRAMVSQAHQILEKASLV